MSGTPTPNYTYNLPTVGGDFETWGELLNENTEKLDDDLKVLQDALDVVEADIVTVNTDIDTKVNKIGDTMTGPLVLPSTDPTNINHAAKKSYVDNRPLSHASRYKFSIATADEDPTAGMIGFDTDHANTATKIYVSIMDTNGISTPIFVNFAEGVVLGIFTFNRTMFYRVISAVDNTAWYTLTVVALSDVNFPVPAANSPFLMAFLGFLEPEEEVVTPPTAYTDYTISTWTYQGGGSSAHEFAHGLDHVPSDVRILFKCVNDVGTSYSVNDILYSPVASAANQAGCTVSADATKVYLGIGDKIYYQPKAGTETNAVLDKDLWDIILRVWS